MQKQKNDVKFKGKIKKIKLRRRLFKRYFKTTPLILNNTLIRVLNKFNLNKNYFNSKLNNNEKIISTDLKKAKLPKFNQILSIKIRANNVFCTLKNIIKLKILKMCSAGKYKINVSKKSLKFNSKIIITTFIKSIRNMLSRKGLIIRLSVPIRYKKKILKIITNLIRFNKRICLFEIKNNKCFNGCRPKKKNRKKQKRFKIFKN